MICALCEKKIMPLEKITLVYIDAQWRHPTHGVYEIAHENCPRPPESEKLQFNRTEEV
jgi:hypothetical protein